jgi:hypothetical protein
LLGAHLRENLISVGVALDVEIHGQLHLPVVGVGGIHIGHVVHAAHLLFDGRRHGLLNGLCVGARIEGVHNNFRRNNIRKLRARQRKDRDCPNNDHEKRNHHRYDRAIDEESRHG